LIACFQIALALYSSCSRRAAFAAGAFLFLELFLPADVQASEFAGRRASVGDCGSARERWRLFDKLGTYAPRAPACDVARAAQSPSPQSA